MKSNGGDSNGGDSGGRADESCEVLVVGAGATGLTLGCDLARRGVRVRVIERRDRLFPGSRGRGLQPRTQEVFDDLGVIGAIRAAGGPYPRMLSWVGPEPQRTWDLVEPATARAGVPYPAPWMVAQWRTQDILLERLRELGGEVEFATALTSWNQDRQSVRATLTRPDHGPATVRADYLVGADGSHSTVRETIGVAMTSETIDPRPALIADVRLTGLDRDNWHMWPKAPGGTLALCPVPGTDHFQLSARFDEGPVDASPAGVRAVIAARTPLSAAAVGEVPWISVYHPKAALAERFRVDRAFLAGDAAHVHPPSGGQGLNTGVQDAYNLGWKLGRRLRQGAPSALLDSYEQERRPVAAGVLGLSTRLHQASRGQGPATVHRGRPTSQLDIGYPDSPLTVEDRPDPSDDLLRAGARVPDATVGDSTRLFDLLRGPQAVLLAVGQPGPTAPRADLADLAVLEFAELAPFGPGLFLIRPDGYLGLATRDPAAVTAYLRLIGSAA